MNKLSVTGTSFADIGHFEKGYSCSDNLILFEMDGRDIQKAKDWMGNIFSSKKACEGRVLFCCLLEGSLSIELNSRQYDLQTGDVYYIFNGDFFCFLDFSENFRCISIVVDHSEKNHIYGIHNVKLLVSFRSELDKKRCFRMKEKTVRKFFFLFQEVREALEEKDLLNKEFIVQNYMQNFFYYMTSDILSENNVLDTHLPTRKEELLLQFMKLVTKHYKEHRKVSYYADKMCLTSKYLSTIVHEVAKKHARNIISEYVIYEAKKQLGNTSMTIQEISNYLHFSCQSFFGKYFKEHTHVSPQAYRKSL